MTKDRKFQIVFDPGCFDDFDGDQEELDSLVQEIHRMADSGELFDNSEPMTQESWDLLPEEVKARLLAEFDKVSTQKTLH